MQSRMTNPLMIVPDALRAVHALGASANKGAQRKQRVDLGDDKRSPRVGLRPPSMRSSLRPLRALRVFAVSFSIFSHDLRHKALTVFRRPLLEPNGSKRAPRSRLSGSAPLRRRTSREALRRWVPTRTGGGGRPG
jgi:hypothetical protein